MWFKFLVAILVDSFRICRITSGFSSVHNYAYEVHNEAE